MRHSCVSTEMDNFCNVFISPVLFPPEAKFRLENGGFSGRVQVSVNNQVGAICADSWDDMDAAVFCRDNVQNAVTGVATT